MLPPVAEVYVVWHPDDPSGAAITRAILDHFHGTPFTGLIGGAVEVYGRSQGWRGPQDAPRPIPLPGTPPPNGLEVAQLVAVVPVLGTGLADSVERGAGPWHDYVEQIVDGHRRTPRRAGVFPVVLDKAAVDGTKLSAMLGQFLALGEAPARPGDAPDAQAVCRDLTQALAQFADPANRRLTIFVSHTRGTEEGEPAGSELVALVRSAIRETRLSEFFDASTLQPGERWAEVIRLNAASSALLAVRTDNYAGRTWCQEEMLVAKRSGMPVVVLDALHHGDERGSFLMDHVPSVPVRRTVHGWDRASIAAGLNRLVGECLKRALWRHQQRLARDRPGLAATWWAPHAPEPATLAAWLTRERRHGRLAGGRPLRIIHPDPPLTPPERDVLAQVTALAGVPGLEIMTPRSLVREPDVPEAGTTDLLPRGALSGMRLGISAAQSPDLDRLGHSEAHFRLALGEITRAVASGGGELIYGGHLRPDGYTAFMSAELQRYARRDRPLLVCLAWHVHRAMPLAELARFRHELGMLGTVVCLDPDGDEIDPAKGRDAAPLPDADPELRRSSLTSMRRYMLEHQHGRVFLGGRREGSEGKLPGLVEEALLTLEQGQPVYLAGGFGGATLDIARALQVDDGAWLPPSESPPDDPRYTEGYQRLRDLARSPGWLGLRNGLTDEENRRLAASHRPSDIAALVSLGLGRLAQSRRE